MLECFIDNFFMKFDLFFMFLLVYKKCMCIDSNFEILLCLVLIEFINDRYLFCFVFKLLKGIMK